MDAAEAPQLLQDLCIAAAPRLPSVGPRPAAVCVLIALRVDVTRATPASTCRELLFSVMSGLLECHWQKAFKQKSLWGRRSAVRCLQLALRPHKPPEQPYHLSCAPPSLV